MNQQEHRQLAKELFNSTWDLIEKAGRTEEDKFKMIHMAHASCFHWGEGGGTPLNQARGEWLISRVYSLAGMGESALAHGQRSLKICVENGYGDFDLAFGYESVARSYALLENEEAMGRYRALADAASEKIKEKDDRDYARKEISGIHMGRNDPS